jgi:hypothetical protein
MGRHRARVEQSTIPVAEPPEREHEVVIPAVGELVIQLGGTAMEQRCW